MTAIQGDSTTRHYTVQSEVSASLRNRADRFTNRSGLGSVSHVFREQGIHIVAETVAEVVAEYGVTPPLVKNCTLRAKDAPKCLSAKNSTLYVGSGSYLHPCARVCRVEEAGAIIVDNDVTMVARQKSSGSR